MAGRWIYGLADLINIDCLQQVSILETNWRHEGSKKSLVSICIQWTLYVVYSSGSGSSVIDKFDKESDAIAARDWFMLLLQGRIDIDDWNVGRKDRDWRKQLELE